MAGAESFLHEQPEGFNREAFHSGIEAFMRNAGSTAIREGGPDDFFGGELARLPDTPFDPSEGGGTGEFDRDYDPTYELSAA